MRPVFALTVSDAVTDDMLEERIEVLGALIERFPSMGAVRVRDDAMDPDLLRRAVAAASGLGVMVVIESDLPENLAAACIPGAVLSSPVGDMGTLVRTAASCGAGVIITSGEAGALLSTASVAEALGCGTVILDPAVGNMKECHERTVRIGRMLSGSGTEGCGIAVRAWSGEYALAVASVGVLDGASLIILDVLDLQACGILDALMRSGIRADTVRRGPCTVISSMTDKGDAVYISRFSRIDTVSWPGRYLSTVRIRDGDGFGESLAEVANTIRGDRDSIDGVLLIREDGDPETIPGIHTFIADLMPPRLPLLMLTSGSDPAAIDDLVGAGYVNRVAFRFVSKPTDAQERSVSVVRGSDASFCIACVLNPASMSAADISAIADMSEGAGEFLLMLPRPPRQCYMKRDVNALAKSLKGRAGNVRVMNDVGTDRDPVRPPGSALCCSC